MGSYKRWAGIKRPLLREQSEQGGAVGMVSERQHGELNVGARGEGCLSVMVGSGCGDSLKVEPVGLDVSSGNEVSGMTPRVWCRREL